MENTSSADEQEGYPEDEDEDSEEEEEEMDEYLPNEIASGTDASPHSEHQSTMMKNF